MKVLLHYEDNEDTELWKSLKITLPKSWKTGPTEKLLGQFVESYNSSKGEEKKHLLDTRRMHLAVRRASGDASSGSSSSTSTSSMVTLASDAVVIEVIPDRADVYVLHGSSQTMADIEREKQEQIEREKKEKANTVACTRFGCKNRFPKGGPYPKCTYHEKPPVFHETAKFWSCCPSKRAYDWEDFQNIPGCCTAPKCTEIQERKDGDKLFLGGTDLREQASGDTKLKSIDDFNRSQAAGGADAAPILDRLQNVLLELGMEKELYQQVLEGMKKDLQSKKDFSNDAEVLDAIAKELGEQFKATFKNIAAEHLRIK